MRGTGGVELGGKGAGVKNGTQKCEPGLEQEIKQREGGRNGLEIAFKA